MPESTIFLTNKLSFTTDKYNMKITDNVSVRDIFSWEYALKNIPGISAGTRTMTSGAGSATFFPDSYSPNALFTVSEVSPGNYSRTESNGYCIDNSEIEVAFFGVPVAKPGFTKQKILNLHINLTSPHT
jgi:hypothetical protein